MFWLETFRTYNNVRDSHRQVFVARASIRLCACVCFGSSWIQNNRHMQHLSNTANPPSRHVVTMPINHNTFDAHAYTYMRSHSYLFTHSLTHTDIIHIGMESIDTSNRARTYTYTQITDTRNSATKRNEYDKHHCRYHRQCRIIVMYVYYRSVII